MSILKLGPDIYFAGYGIPHEFLHAIEYPAIAGKTVKNAKSWIEDGIAVFELTFTDETSFTFQCLPQPKTWARSFDPEGEVIETWE